jgi:hypothetical protein
MLDTRLDLRHVRTKLADSAEGPGIPVDRLDVMEMEYTWISADAASCKRTACKPQKCR